MENGTIYKQAYDMNRAVIASKATLDELIKQGKTEVFFRHLYDKGSRFSKHSKCSFQHIVTTYATRPWAKSEPWNNSPVKIAFNWGSAREGFTYWSELSTRVTTAINTKIGKYV